MQNLKINKVEKRLNQRKILNNIDITIQEGTIHIIEGKSGSGKSTLLNVMGGMEEPTTGEVLLNGKNLYKLSDREQSQIRSKDFGFVFQAFHLLPELTVKENILLPVQMNESQSENFSAEYIAEKLQIDNLLDKRIMHLSGGEQQRVAIARSVINHPSIIFLDEPTGNLDDGTSSVVMEFLLHLHEQYQTSLVIVSHQKDLVSKQYHAYMMSDGIMEKMDENI